MTSPFHFGDELGRAIGLVAHRSAFASNTLEVICAALTGDGGYFARKGLVDDTLGTQTSKVRALLDARAKPSSTPEFDDLADGFLTGLDGIVPFRNRIIHDLWLDAPFAGHTDGVFGHRPRKVGASRSTRSTVGTFEDIATTIWVMAGGLFVSARGIGLPVSDNGVELPKEAKATLLDTARAYAEDIGDVLTALNAGEPHPRWVWQHGA